MKGIQIQKEMWTEYLPREATQLMSRDSERNELHHWILYVFPQSLRLRGRCKEWMISEMPDIKRLAELELYQRGVAWNRTEVGSRLDLDLTFL